MSYILHTTTRGGKLYAISPDDKLVPIPANNAGKEALRLEFEILYYELKFDKVIEFLTNEELSHPDYEMHVAKLHQLEAKLAQLLRPAVTMAQSGITEVSTIDLKRK